MDRLDEFESLFRAADKARFHYHPLDLRSVLCVTDLAGDALAAYERDARAFCAVLDRRREGRWVTVGGDRFRSPKELLDLVEAQRPDLIVTYRCLHSDAWQWSFTLGAHLDVLTQATTTPVLVLPHPERGGVTERVTGVSPAEVTDRVMAVTNHLAGDEQLVNAALAFAEPGGTLFLTHIEDDATFARYCDAISKIPEIDTAVARERIKAQLLKEATDYVRSVAGALEAAAVGVTAQAIVAMGHAVAQYQTLLAEHAIDLLVMNTKDDGHSAMHGLAYALAVELRTMPLLML